MRFIAFLVLGIAILIASFAPASAALFERDWKMPGDGQLTYDDVSQREWLDLSVSRLEQFSEPRLENAIAEISSGGLFEGFTWAKRDDVLAFAQSTGIDTTTVNILINETPTRALIELLGPTLVLSDDPNSIGFIDDGPAIPSQSLPRVGAEFVIHEPFPDQGYAGLLISLSDDRLTAPANGLMLYRVVPEPSTVLSLCVGIGLLIFGRLSIHFRSR